MKRFMLATASFALIFTLTSCDNAPKQEDTKKVAEEHNEAKFNNNKEKDAQFLVNAAEVNLEEIKLGEIAKTNGKMPEVKKMGEMMVMEHGQALKDLQVLAAKKQITIPTSITDNGQEAYKKMMNKKGSDFDKAYCDMMVDGHKSAVENFEKVSMGEGDADIKGWATSMLPTLRAHLDASITCQKKCEKMKM